MIHIIPINCQYIYVYQLHAAAVAAGGRVTANENCSHRHNCEIRPRAIRANSVYDFSSPPQHHCRYRLSAKS